MRIMRSSGLALGTVLALSACVSGGTGRQAPALTAAGNATLPYSPSLYAAGAPVGAPVAVAPMAGTAPAGMAGPARVGIAIANPSTGAESFTTDRALSAEEQMRYAAEYCRGYGRVLDPAAFLTASRSAAGSINASGQFCR
ncbi:MAG: hypothetical protein R3D78_04545 [Paracoccaceae bacterium]